MNDTKKFNALIIILIVCYGISFGAKTLINTAGTGGYILALAGGVASFLIYGKIYGINQSQISPADKTGRIIIYTAGLLLMLSALVQAVAICCITAKSLGNVFMKKTPFEYTLLFILLACTAGTCCGTKAVSRYAATGGIAALVITITVLLFAYENYDIKNLMPLTGRAFSEGKNIFLMLSVYSNAVYLWAISPQKSKKQTKANLGSVILISGGIITAICFVTSLILPFETLSSLSDPLLYTASTVNFSFLVERSEAAVFIVRLLTAFISISSLLCIVCRFATDIFKLSDRKAIIPSILIITACATLIADRFDLSEQLMYFSAIWTLGISLILPSAINVYYKSYQKRKTIQREDKE